ncbi:MAG: TrmB family transcriptional regulator [Candidatus Bathyarchaeia archaeon]|jgi:sugar-specific transcriptional regulator TrmB
MPEATVWGEKRARAQFSEQEEISVLLNLGCSLSQARVYYELIQIGSATISSISKATGIYRENVYKIINSMIEKGLVEKEIDNPTKYHTLPPEEVLPMLINRKQEQISQVKREAQRVIKKLHEKAGYKTVTECQGQFMVISGRNSIIDRVKKTLDKAQISIETITTQKRFSQAIVEFAEAYENALRRGVKIRLATEKHIPEKRALKIIGRLKKNPDFQVRYFSQPIPAIAALFDGKETHISLSRSAQLFDAEGLWSNNSCVVAVAKAYFEEKWAQSCQ